MSDHTHSNLARHGIQAGAPTPAKSERPASKLGLHHRMNAARLAWGESAAALLDATIHPCLEAEAQRQATQLVTPLVGDCAKFSEPFQHIVPLLAVVHLLHDLAALCGDDPAFIDVAAELAHRMRRAGALTLQDMIGNPPA